MNLWIIGNGFDKYHGLPTGYNDFVQYLLNHGKEHLAVFLEVLLDRNLLKSLKGQNRNAAIDSLRSAHRAGESYLWSDFETNLGSIYHAQINCVRDMFNTNGQFWIRYVCECKKQFAKWANSIDKMHAERKIDIRYFEDEDLFLSFNYTSFLEKLYNISPQRVLHIHGTANNERSIVVGHGHRPQKANHSEDVYDFLCQTYKNTTRIIDNNKDFFNQLHCIKEPCNVYVVGCSMSPVDHAYFRKISSHLPQAQWYRSLYLATENDLKGKVEEAYASAQACGIKSRYMNCFDITDLQTIGEMRIIQRRNLA